MIARKSLLVEVGVEELPASFVEGALRALPPLIEEGLERLRLGGATARLFGTPRRLAWLVPAVAERQSDAEELLLGPPAAVAFDSAGQLTRAGQSFVERSGVTADAWGRQDTAKGQRVTAVQRFEGAPAVEVLGPWLSELIASIPFRKSMRWGEQDAAFGRPVRWLVALHDEAVVPFEFAGLQSGRTTHGHRFLAPRAIALPRADAYEELLAEAQVIACPERRDGVLRQRLSAAAQQLDGELVADEDLLRECLHMVEAPQVLPGSFDEGFLRLPEQVIVAVMRDHQKYFALRRHGALLPAYLNAVNTALAPEVIRTNNDRVLRARLADAAFFIDEDAKKPLSEHAKGLSGITFHAKLGSVADKAGRIAAIGAWLLQQSRFRAGMSAIATEEISAKATALEHAAALCKADLVTLIVGEFPELQGVAGTYYALREGIDEEVAQALAEHYRPLGSQGALPSGPLGTVLALADRLDTLVACFAVGIRPTGSADPFALRRAALGVVRIALEGGCDFPLREGFRVSLDALGGVPTQPRAEVLASLEAFVEARLRNFLGSTVSAAALDGALGSWSFDWLSGLRGRLQAVEKLADSPSFAELVAAIKRARSLVGREGASLTAGKEVDAGLFAQPAEHTLWQAAVEASDAVDRCLAHDAFAESIEALARALPGPIHRFFEEVRVMDESAHVRDNRLRLLGHVNTVTSKVLRFDAFG